MAEGGGKKPKARKKAAKRSTKKASSKARSTKKGRARQPRFEPDRLKEAGGILADLNKKSPAKTLLGGTSREHMGADADAVLGPPPDEAPEPTQEVETAPAEPTQEVETLPAEPEPDETPAEAEEAPAPAPAASQPAGLDALLDTVAREGLTPRPQGEDDDDDIPVHIDRSTRVPLESYVKVVKGERVARALAHDISLTGIYLAAMALPVVQPGDEVTLEVTLPGLEEPLWVKGLAVREKTDQGFHAIAIHFLHLGDADRRAIEDYVETRAHLV